MNIKQYKKIKLKRPNTEKQPKKKANRRSGIVKKKKDLLSTFI